MLSLYVLLLEAFKSSNKNFEIRIRTTNTSSLVPDHLCTIWTQIYFCLVPDERRFLFAQYQMNVDLDQYQMNAEFFLVPNEHRASPTVPNECRFLPSTRWMQTFSHSTGWTQIFSHSTGWTQTLSHSTRWTQSFFPQYRMNVEANIVCSTGWTQFCSTRTKLCSTVIEWYQNFGNDYHILALNILIWPRQRKLQNNMQVSVATPPCLRFCMASCKQCEMLKKGCSEGCEHLLKTNQYN